MLIPAYLSRTGTRLLLCPNGILYLVIHHSIAVLGLLRHPRFNWSLDRQNARSLMLVSLRHRSPDAHSLRSGGNILHGEVVGEAKGAGWRAEFLGIRSGLGGQLACRKKEQQQRRENSQSHGDTP